MIHFNWTVAFQDDGVLRSISAEITLGHLSNLNTTSTSL